MRNSSLPTGTRASVVVGLGSVTSKKWNLFLKGGPYWNYIARYLAAKKYFVGHPDLLDIAVNATIDNVSRSFAAGHFVYKAPGVGYFRAFLKTVATRAALTLIKKEKRATIGTEAQTESDLFKEDGEDSRADSRTLDSYDETAGVTHGRKSKSGDGVRLTSMSALAGVFEDDGSEGTHDPASMSVHAKECSDREIAFLKRVRLNVFNLALTSVLCDDRIAVRRREVLELYYVQRLKPGQIYARDAFSGLKRNAFDQLVCNAKLEMARPVLELWKAVAPESCADSEAQLKKLWLNLSRGAKTWKLARKLYQRTRDEAGDLESM